MAALQGTLYSRSLSLRRGLGLAMAKLNEGPGQEVWFTIAWYHEAYPILEGQLWCYCSHP